MRLLRTFGRFWWDFVVGDDWRIAAGVAAILGLGALLVATTAISDTAVSVLLGTLLVAVVATSILLPGLRARREM